MQKRIAESELILNKDGGVYHLNLLPEELADTIITVGDPDRVKSVSRCLDKIEVRKKHREFITHTGYIGKNRVSIVSTGIGTDNIDIVMNELDALANIDLKSRMPKKTAKSLKIVRLGTSGSMQAHLEVDTVLVSAHAIGLDTLMQFYKLKSSAAAKTLQNHLFELFQLPAYVTDGNADLVKKFQTIANIGTTVTCPGFYAPQGRALRYQLKHPNLLESLSKMSYKKVPVTNFEMETSGIYALGGLLGHQCLSVNLLVANRVTKQFSTQADKFMKKMIADSLAIIEKL